MRRPRRPRTQPLRTAPVVRAILNEAGLTAVLDHVRLMERWEKVVGPTLARSAWVEMLDGRTLVIAVSHPALKQELMLRRDEILARVRAIVKDRVIEEMVLRLRHRPLEVLPLAAPRPDDVAFAAAVAAPTEDPVVREAMARAVAAQRARAKKGRLSGGAP